MAQRNKEHRFDLAPQVEIPRCMEPYNQNIKGTIKAGDLVPFFCDMGVNPGDTFKIKMSSVIRMLTPITPVMDNCFLDVYFMAVPWRLTWEHTKEFWGENTNSAWYTTTEYTIPKLKSGSSASFDIGSIVDYMGLTRPGVNNVNISALPVRAYISCFNNWFRDQNLIAPETERINDSDTTYDFTDATKGGAPLKIAKYHDYFTSCLPGAQKGAAVTLPIGTTAPVYGTGDPLQLIHSATTPTDAISALSNITTLSGQNHTATNVITKLTPGEGTFVKPVGGAVTAFTDTGTPSNGIYLGVADKKNLQYITGKTSGIYTDLTGALAAPISVVREAFAYQRILERMALAGKLQCLQVKKIAEKIWKTFIKAIRGEGASQPQRIAIEII